MDAPDDLQRGLSPSKNGGFQPARCKTSSKPAGFGELDAAASGFGKCQETYGSFSHGGNGKKGHFPNDMLASETRREILELLSEKNHRPSDLSRELGKDKSTIVEHLEKLRRAGLVERVERKGHKWVFYALSKNGEACFPDRRRRVVFLALAIIAALGAMVSFLAYLQPQEETALQAGMPGAGEKMLAAQQEPRVAGAQKDVYLYASVALLTLFAAAGAHYLIIKANRFVMPRMK